MTSTTNKSQELQQELIVQLEQCKSKYTNLLLMSDELDTEMTECNEHFITCFIQFELLEHNIQSLNSTSSKIMNTYDNRFFVGEKAEPSDGWNGVFMYNYADLVYDDKVRMNAFVMNEKRVFITLWYLIHDSNGDDEIMIKQRKKTDDRLTILKRCSIG